jgi:hypothetical protein
MQTCSLKEGPVGFKAIFTFLTRLLYILFLLWHAYYVALVPFASLYAFPVCAARTEQSSFTLTHSRTCVRMPAYLGYFSLERGT